MTKYPTQNEIHELFGNLSGKGSPEVFFEAVSPDVDWTVMGTHPLAGRYPSRSEFRAATFGRLGKIMKPSGLGVRNIIGGGDQPWAVVELVLNGVCNNGFVFDNCYAWCIRFNEEGKIAQVRAYLDSWMVRQAIVENEIPSERATVPRVGSLTWPN